MHRSSVRIVADHLWIVSKGSLSTVSNMGTFFESLSTTPTRAISIVYSLMDDGDKAQASVCYVGQY